ncbi:hypothetical protein [Pseudaminobacter salicylatoxidans]|uniref:hypothetical protein n=1 Tax=Pseudaminobacter salicylatoxidans TaxID=93369 RepID=UPI00031DA948|nr:hypothetical protein [Pseudaminobacter salicylatoxidans]
MGRNVAITSRTLEISNTPVIERPVIQRKLTSMPTRSEIAMSARAPSMVPRNRSLLR